MPTPPKLSPEQRQAALEKAALARQVRAAAKQRLKNGALTLPELFDRADTDQMLAKIKALTVLESLPGVGKVKARRIMAEVGIAESRRIAGLGVQQRKTLLSLIYPDGVSA